MNLPRRPRRNRQSAAVRALVRETRLSVEDLIYPVFLSATAREPEPIESLPGIFRHTLESLLVEVQRSVEAGLRAVAVFPCIAAADKTPEGTFATASENILLRALSELRATFPDLVLIADVALDPYTSHGHDGILTADGSSVDNDRTVAALGELAVAEARAGATWVAPSDMMDGRVGAIRDALDAAGFTSTGILAYSAKFASAFYGPFRDAVGSKVGGQGVDKSDYQLDPANAREAQLEVDLDFEEGADLVMVKPAGPYLDIIRAVAERSPVPVAAYQVSGEYAQIHAAARLGWLDYRQTRDESLLAIKRAGADLILTYFAREVAEEWLH
jgi:porphobilinogen synthase